MKSAKIKNGSSTGTIAFAQMMIADLEPDSVTLGNTTIAAAKKAAAAKIKFLLFVR